MISKIYFITLSHLKKAFASFTGSHSVMLTGSVVSTHCAASLVSCGAPYFRRQLSIHQSWAIPAALLQAEWAEGKRRTVLLGLRKGILIWKLWLQRAVMRKLVDCDVPEREERGSLVQRLLWTPTSLIGGAGTKCAIPGRHVLEPRGRGWRRRRRTSKAVWPTWRRQRLIKVTQSECAWVTAVHLEVVQLERVLPRGATSKGRSSACCDLARVGIKLANVASDQRGDAGQGGCGELVQLVSHIHGQPGGEVRIQKLWAEEGTLIGLDSMLTLNTGHFCRTEPQHLLFNTVDIAAEKSNASRAEHRFLTYT